MKPFHKCLNAFWMLLLLGGCSSVNIQDYKEKKPRLLIEDYFDGNTKAWGIFQDRFGKVRRQFTVDIIGTWSPDTQTLELVENFVYDDGQTEQRIWNIKKTGKHTYQGKAAGVIGLAQGESYGNAFNLKYTFDLPYKEGKLRVNFDDWMYLQDENVLFNKASISKYGFRLGDVYIFFEKQSP